MVGAGRGAHESGREQRKQPNTTCSFPLRKTEGEGMEGGEPAAEKRPESYVYRA